MFSRRTGFDLTANALGRALDAARASGQALLDLTVANPTAAGIPYEAASIRGALGAEGALLYEPAAFGLPSAREAVGRHLGVSPGRVVLTASTSEAYSFLFKLLCDPGDDVLVPAPSYPLFEHLARLEAVRVVPYRLVYAGEWQLDVASVRAAVGPRTRAVLTVSPNNPTGSYLKRGELEALGGLGLPLVSDEVFASYPLRSDPSRVLTATGCAAPLVFALGGLSKQAGLPQMKLGWTVVSGEPARVQEALARLEVVADAFLSVGAPVQHALPSLLAGAPVAARAIADRTRRNLASLRSALAGSAVTVLDVEGGWYATLQVPRTRSEEAWALELLERDGVVVHPGHFFDFAAEAFLIVSLLAPEDAFREGISRLGARVASGA